MREKGGRRIVEPNFSSQLSLRNKKLQSYFVVKSVMMKEKRKEKAKENGDKNDYIEVERIGVISLMRKKDYFIT